MFNKILGYFKYRKIIKENLFILRDRYKFRYDSLYGRLYTVIGISKERQEVLKTYGYEYLDNEVKKFIATIEQYFSTIGLLDLITISRVDSLDAVNVLIVLRYRYVKHQFVLYAVSFLLSLSTVSILLAGLYKLVLFLINYILLM